jgi:hypothetical protein
VCSWVLGFVGTAAVVHFFIENMVEQDFEAVGKVG